MLINWASIGNFDISKFDCDPTQENIQETFILNKAIYHHSSYTNKNELMLDREEKPSNFY